MSFTILLFIAVVVINVVSAQKKAKAKELCRKMMQNPTDFTDEDESANENGPVPETLRKLLEKYADAHPEDVSARRTVRQAEAPQPTGEITVEQLSDAAYEKRLEQERTQALMDYRRERLVQFKKSVGMSKESFRELQQKVLDPKVSDDDFEEILKDTEVEQRRKRTVARKFVPDDCEMQKTLQSKAKELAKNPIRAKAPVLADEKKHVSRSSSSETGHLPETKSCKPKFRLTVAEARRGIVLSKILEEPRYRKRWNPVSR